MNTPNVRYYALFEETARNDKNGNQKFTITRDAGYYPPMEDLRGKDGKISMWYLDKTKEGINAPSKRLQAKNSLNFTGLKDLFQDGKLTGFAYGYPLAEKTYSAKKKPNPLYDYRADGFLFLVHPNKDLSKPTSIELLVLTGCKPLIAAYCKMLQQGGFGEALELLRKQADAL